MRKNFRKETILTLFNLLPWTDNHGVYTQIRSNAAFFSTGYNIKQSKKKCKCETMNASHP